MADRRVVITGMGAVTPLGVSMDAFWDGLIEARSGVSRVSIFDASTHPVKIGAECRTFHPADHLDRKTFKRLDRFVQFALVASREAVKEAGLEMDDVDACRAAIIYGTGIGGLAELEDQHARLLTRGPAKVSPFTIPKLMVNAASANISMAFGIKGESLAVSSACASASSAMARALAIIRRNEADVVFTGGSEAALTPLALAAFASMKALSSRNDDPEHASRPFDRDRDGFVLGEGAATLIFEELEHAKKRRATILAEVLGYGATSDAGHITQPDEEGEGAAGAIRASLKDAAIDPDQVDYINAHGTGTPLGDIAESKAISRVFGDHAKRLTISSTKSAIGHLLGASGGVELVATVRAIQNGVIPPTLNLDNPDEGCDLDYCPHTARDKSIRIALSNSFGFGGHNACILLRRFEG
jgi:3-oxoacyl-[acyl-carrier-protein] synthase II